MDTIAVGFGLGIMAAIGVLYLIFSEVTQSQPSSRPHSRPQSQPYSSYSDVGYNTACPICLLDVDRKSQVIKLTCGHKYHSLCLQMLIQQDIERKCALCRREIDIRIIRSS